jgi:transposase
MLSLRLPTRVLLCTLPTDMRRSFDSLAGMVCEHLGHDPLAGDLFVFRSKRGDRVKLLYFEPDGFCLWYKRLEQGTFKFPAAADAAAAAGLRRVHKAGDHGLEIDADDLALLLEGIDLASIKRAPRYRRDPAGRATTSATDDASATP